jgi:hypothetical protein
MQYIIQRFRADGFLYQVVLTDETGLVLQHRTYSQPLPIANEVVTSFPTLPMASGSFNREANDLTNYLSAFMPGTYDKKILHDILYAQIVAELNQED